MNQLLFKCFERTSEFVPLIQQLVQIVGGIFFLNYGVFSFQIARVSMKHLSFGVYESDTLIQSFYAKINND